jgi:hypothetical protein
VIWLNSPNEIAAKIKYGLNNSVEIVANAQNGLWLWGKILLKLLSKFECENCIKNNMFFNS